MYDAFRHVPVPRGHLVPDRGARRVRRVHLEFLRQAHLEADGAAEGAPGYAVVQSWELQDVGLVLGIRSAEPLPATTARMIAQSAKFEISAEEASESFASK